MNSFNELRLPHALQRALAAMHFETPTPIQAQAIPVIEKGADLIGIAQTGTGKTAAFSIPILKKMLEQPGKTGLILAPTRELAIQIAEVWKQLTAFAPQAHAALLIGGVPMKSQSRALSRRPMLVIATPGRLLDHLHHRTANLSRLGHLVLDEADRMLDMGFEPQLTQILKFLPRERQTLLFSATWAKEMDQLSKRYLKNPERVVIGSVSQAAVKVEQKSLLTSHKEKNNTLLDELNARQGSVLVFARTQNRTDRVTRFLDSYGVQVDRIHGGRTQGQRNKALKSFKAGTVRVLIATDIAARGIDVADISHVINYDLPQVAEDYIHRIGRTGRAGASGQALSLLTPEDRGQWKEITRLLEKSGSRIPTVLEKRGI